MKSSQTCKELRTFQGKETANAEGPKRQKVWCVGETKHVQGAGPGEGCQETLLGHTSGATASNMFFILNASGSH